MRRAPRQDRVCHLFTIRASAINTQRYEKKEKRLGYAELCALLPGCEEHESIGNKESGAILDASPFELRRQLEYKTQWRGGLLVPIAPQNTSRKCPECGHMSAENRKSQAKFVCGRCGFSAPADFVSAVNIREAGLASPVRRLRVR